MRIDALESDLSEHGFATVDLPDPSPVHATRERLLGWLRDRDLPGLARLEDYHLRIEDEARHVAVVHALSVSYWEAALGQAIVAANLDLFRALIGRDLHIQRHPYLRVVRPARPRDAAPLHRDTYYGASPFEISVLVPLTEMDGDSALRVVAGSHVSSDAEYPYDQQVSPDVVVRSPKHQLGFPYAPRALDPALSRRALRVPLSVGQAAIFGLSLVHGGGVNDGARTRFSTDIRLANSLAPVAWSRGVDPDYLVPLCTSAVTRSARRYLEANRAAAPREPGPVGGVAGP